MTGERTATVRLTTEVDAPLLPAIERAAAALFRSIPDLAWIADDEVQSVAQHMAHARAGTSWVIVDDADQPFGFLSAEVCGPELHIWELAVRQDRQGRGAGRMLLEASFDHARRQRLEAVTLTTFRDVRWNEPLYAHFGFAALSTDEVGDRLSRVLAGERLSGLPSERRCAMRLVL